jgi:hypothetical protein
MNTTWSFILAGAVALASAAGIVGGETAKSELRFAEAATSMSAGPGVFAWLGGTETTVVSVQQSGRGS